MPPADKAVITALLLPSSYVISSGNAKSPTEFLSQLNIVLDKGYRLLQLRAKDLSAEAYAKLARNCLRDCSKVGASLMLNASAELVAALGASGMHLGSKALLNCTRRPLGDNYLVAASCHNRNEIQKAVDIGVDFIILSPVLPTPSHPDALPLAWAGFERLVANCPLPVYALGGMHTGYIGEAHSRGAQGVAGISAFWPPYHS